MEYSLTINLRVIPSMANCLNPCSNGILSDSKFIGKSLLVLIVLILVLMEYSLTMENFEIMRMTWKVLILVLMEYSLAKEYDSESKKPRVLILVLMEYSLTLFR